ncbi:MAG: hypothetical protein KHX00_08190 [Bacteroides sp.]|nr:hypothetical protein [Bacteroides sp.]
MKKFSLFAILLGFNIALGACSDDDAAPVVKNEIFQLPEKAYVLAEQSRRAIVIRDAETHRNIWSWDPYTACVPAAQQGWFVNPSEVKPVFNRRYILMTASGGAVALIRLSDHKLMFYANCGQNPHSAEVLPDGNIVTAESKSGEINTFVVDTVKVLGAKANTVKLGNAHNVVWDKKRSYLYATATKKEGVTALFRFKYDGNRSNPKLINQTTLYTFSNESGGHDLFPPTCEKVYSIADIKSICNGPDGILMLKPTEEWWAEGLVNEKGEELFKMDGAKIYKGRWMIDNLFSYPEKHDFVLSED